MNPATLTQRQFRPTFFVAKFDASFFRKKDLHSMWMMTLLMFVHKNIENNFVCPFNNYYNLYMYRPISLPYPIQKSIQNAHKPWLIVAHLKRLNKLFFTMDFRLFQFRLSQSISKNNYKCSPQNILIPYFQIVVLRKLML